MLLQKLCHVNMNQVFINLTKGRKGLKKLAWNKNMNDNWETITHFNGLELHHDIFFLSE